MLTSPQGFNGLFRMILNGRIDMYRVYIFIIQQVVIISVPVFDSKCITNLVEFLFIPLADRIHISVWVTLVNRDKLGTETKTDDCYINFTFPHVHKNLK